jgi:glycosyltransferase involved in cell wall biosynthesis
MKVLVFNHAFFHISETFVYKQVTGMPDDISVDLLGFSIENEQLFPLSNKKYSVKRVANVLDKAIVAFRKNILGQRYSFSLFTKPAVKRILSQTKYDVIHAHFGFNALLIFPLAKLMNIPLVITFHGLDASPQMLQDNQYKDLLQKMLEYASAIIIVSPHMKKTLELENYADKTYIIPCGVDPDEFNIINRPENKNSITILHSGRMVSKKGVPDLVTVFASLSKKYNNISLVLIGDGPDLEASRQRSAQAREGSVTFLGARPHEQVKKYMADADIFVLNSRVGDKGDMEGVPVSLLEAMSLKMAIVSTRHAGIPYVVADGVNGLLVDEKDNSSLSAAIEKLINDAELRKELGESARRTVSEKLTSSQTNRKIADVYRNVTKVN